jgi:hypothetical protein
VFVVIETLQVFFLLRNNMKMKSLIASVITDPDYAASVAENLLFGFMERVSHDQQKQDIFFGFVGTIGVNAVASIREYYGGGGAGQPGVKLKSRSPFKPFEGIINQVLPGMLDKMVKGKADKVVENVVETW